MVRRSLSNSLFSMCSSCLAYLFTSFLPSFLSQQGANRISWAQSGPLGHGLLGVYSKIFLNVFEQKSFKKSWKILKIFITLLCYGLHQKFVKNMSLSKKFKSIYNSFYYFKKLVTMFSKCFWVFSFILSISKFWNIYTNTLKITLCENNSIWIFYFFSKMLHTQN
jgi:hypothetical protein